MIKYLRNERGYALLLTLLILIMFSILGMSMLALSSQGIKQNTYRADDTQAIAQSEKGIDRIVADINTELTSKLGVDGLSSEKFKIVLDDVLRKYRCEKSHIVSNNTHNGEYDVCIDKEPESIRNEDNTINDLRKIVSFSSTGSSNNKNRNLNKIMEIGAEAFPETMKYALGTNTASKTPKNGEGNLYLHGGSEITGDLKVDGNLVVKDSGVAGYAWVQSVLPTTIPSPGSTSSKLVLGKSMYFISNLSLNQNSYTNHINRDMFNTSAYQERTDIKTLFLPNSSPRIVKREQLSPDIGIITQRSNYFFDHTSTSALKVLAGNSSSGFSGTTFSKYSNNAAIVPIKGTVAKPTAFGDFSLKDKNSFGQLASSGHVKINTGDHTFTKGLYVAKTLDIGKFGSNRETEQTPRENITLDGPMYIDGDLTMRNVNLKGNTLIYVNGDVSIRFSTLEGKDLGNKKTGTVIIFATGDISMSNISAYSDTPSLIKGFFYSQGNIEMYGTGSNVKVEGGISAKRIVFNAIRGKASSNGTYENAKTQPDKPSRLQVVYDTEIIENFLKLSKPEPIITKIDPAIEKERVLTNVKKQPGN